MLKWNIYRGWRSKNIIPDKIIILIFFAHLALRQVRVHILYKVMHASTYFAFTTGMFGEFSLEFSLAVLPKILRIKKLTIFYSLCFNIGGNHVQTVTLENNIF